MSRKVLVMVVFLAVVAGAGIAFGQTVGSSSRPFGITDEEMAQIAKGWSAHKHLLGKNVYNTENDKIGVIEDLIITPGKGVSYAVIAVGGFLGMNKHNVVIPVSQINVLNDKLTLPGATKKSIKAIPAFKYTQ